jgi:uncharacterized membrane protein YebE (DUF533 family)
MNQQYYKYLGVAAGAALLYVGYKRYYANQNQPRYDRTIHHDTTTVKNMPSSTTTDTTSKSNLIDF